MGIFGNKHSKGGLTAIFDIESGSVGVALVRLVSTGSASKSTGTARDPKLLPHVIWSTREEFLFKENISWDRLLKSMYTALEHSCEMLRTDGMRAAADILKTSHIVAPDKIVCIFSSPWYTSYTKLIHIEKEKPFNVDEAFFRKIREDIATKLGVPTPDRKKGSDGSDKEYDILEQAIINIRLNGYEMEKPLGKRARLAEMTMFVAEMRTDMTRGVVDRINTYFEDIPVSVHSCVLALYSILRNLFPAQKSGLMVHVTGEVVDVSLFNDGILLETISFPFGSNSIIRKAAASTATTPAHLRSILKLAKSAEGGDTQTIKAKKAFEKAHIAWSAHWREAAAHLSDEIGFLPRQVFVFSQGEYAYLYANWINNEDFGAVDSSSPFRTTYVFSPFLKNYIKQGNDVDRDLLLDIEALYLQDSLSTNKWL